MVVAPVTTCVGVAVSELEDDDAGALNPWDEVWWRMLLCAIPRTVCYAVLCTEASFFGILGVLATGCVCRSRGLGLTKACVASVLLSSIELPASA